MTLQPYDYVAAAVIIEEAGGCISQIDGSDISMYRHCSVLAGTPKTVEETREILMSLQSTCEQIFSFMKKQYFLTSEKQ